MKFEIKHRWSGAVLFTAELDAKFESEPHSVQLGAAVKIGVSADADLTGAYLADADLARAYLADADLARADLARADLAGAYLARANLAGADLTGAYLAGAYLARANLTGADLAGAYLAGAYLARANLARANLARANLTDADLDPIKWDFWGRLSVWANEADGLLAAIKEGRINGSSYEGECACFVGTIANLRQVSIDSGELNGLTANSDSPTERLFMAIKQGDTPDTNPASRIIAEWCEQFIAHRDRARQIK